MEVMQKVVQWVAILEPTTGNVSQFNFYNHGLGANDYIIKTRSLKQGKETPVLSIRVGSCEHGNEQSGSIQAGKFLTSYMTVSFSRRTLLHGVSYCQYGENRSIAQRRRRRMRLSIPKI
jgi:hypothetical protein